MVIFGGLGYFGLRQSLGLARPRDVTSRTVRVAYVWGLQGVVAASRRGALLRLTFFALLGGPASLLFFLKTVPLPSFSLHFFGHNGVPRQEMHWFDSLCNLPLSFGDARAGCAVEENRWREMGKERKERKRERKRKPERGKKRRRRGERTEGSG